MDAPDWTTLDRFAAGESSPEEAAEVERWLATDPARRALIDAMRTPKDGDAWDVDAAWSSVRSRALGDGGGRRRKAATPGMWGARGAWNGGVLLRVAAVVLVAGAAVVGGGILLDRKEAPSMVVAATTRSQSDTLRLEDGSLVILGAESTLEYPRAFGARARAVRLTGEAFFRVVADAARPFDVTAGGVRVRVVGTEFVVRTGDGVADDVTVAVAEGAVQVSAESVPDTAAVVVVRGQVARVAADGATSVESAADLDPFLGWLDGRLAFEDAALRVVLAELQRWYPLEFHADDVLLERPVTARLRARSLEESVAALALALGAVHRRTGDTIHFTINQSTR